MEGAGYQLLPDASIDGQSMSDTAAAAAAVAAPINDDDDELPISGLQNQKHCTENAWTNHRAGITCERIPAV